jgi:hypothetical protein
LAASTGLFIEIDPEAMFAKHIASRASAAKP